MHFCNQLWPSVGEDLKTIQLRRIATTDDATLAVLKSIQKTLAEHTGGLAAAPAAVLARQFMTHNDLLSGVGDGAALEEAQLLMYSSGGSQERIERGSQSLRATSKPAANGLPMPRAAHCESAW